MTYLYLKAIHIVFIVCWFAGVFYLPRLFIYHAEAQQQEEKVRAAMSRQYIVMAKRLWFGITVPAAVITLITGLLLITERHFWSHLFDGSMLWLSIKLVLVIFFLGYNYSLYRILLQQKNGNFNITSQRLRLWNEVATVILVAIVFVAVVKSALSLVYGIVGLVLLIIILLAAINIYKKSRLRKPIQ